MVSGSREKIVQIIKKELTNFGALPKDIDILGYNVGVKGDRRAYGWTVVFGSNMQLPWETLKNIEQQIVSKVPEVTRVLYEINNEK